jgi:hypothetical protein
MEDGRWRVDSLFQLSTSNLRGIHGLLGRNALCTLSQFTKSLRLNGETARTLHVLEGLVV